MGVTDSSQQGCSSCCCWKESSEHRNSCPAAAELCHLQEVTNPGWGLDSSREGNQGELQGERRERKKGGRKKGGRKWKRGKGREKGEGRRKKGEGKGKGEKGERKRKGKNKGEDLPIPKANLGLGLYKHELGQGLTPPGTVGGVPLVPFHPKPFQNSRIL